MASSAVNSSPSSTWYSSLTYKILTKQKATVGEVPEQPSNTEAAPSSSPPEPHVEHQAPIALPEVQDGLSPTSIPTSNLNNTQLKPPPKNSPAHYPPVTKSNLLFFLASTPAPLDIRPHPNINIALENGVVQELRDLINVFGSSRKWVLDADEIYCRTCVEDASSKVWLFGDQCNAVYIPLCKHEVPLIRLFRELGPRMCCRILYIRLKFTIRSPLSKTLAILASAVQIIRRIFPNIVRAEVFVHCDETLVVTHFTHGEAHEIARSLGKLEKSLPKRIGLKVRGLDCPGLERVARHWRSRQRTKLWVVDTRIAQHLRVQRTKRRGCRQSWSCEGWNMPV